MKKEYSLDYEIERDTDRLEAVRAILDEMKGTPTQKDLETMASYILYGKDENGLNSIQRGETRDNEDKRYKSYKKSHDRSHPPCYNLFHQPYYPAEIMI